MMRVSYLYSTLIITLLTFLGGSTFAQTDSTSGQSGMPKYSFINEDYRESSSIDKIDRDTNLTGFQYYHPLYRNYVGFQHLGNIGSAYQNLYFTPNLQRGFGLGINTFDEYLFGSNYYKQYDVDTPITQLWYYQGAENLIYLRALHTQNFGERFNIGVKFRRLTSDGLYFNQSTDYYNTHITSHFANRTYRYKMRVFMTFDRMENMENGGIASDSIFENIDGAAPVLLNAVNAHKNNTYAITQTWRFKKPNFKTHVIDSTKTDTVYQDVLFGGRLVHNIKYSRNSWSYFDESHDSVFYDNFFKDTLTTFDSIDNKILSNALAYENWWRLGNYKSHLVLFYKNHIIDYNEVNGYSANYVNNALGFYSYIGTSKLHLSAEVENHFGGYNDGDAYYKLLASKGFKANSTLSIALTSQKAQPGFTQRYLSANNYAFYNPEFKQQELSKVKITFVRNGKDNKDFSNRTLVSAEQKTVNNFIYYDTSTQVKQANAAINVTSFALQRNFKVGRFHLDNDIVYQMSDNDSIVRLPDLMSKHSLYYQSITFKGALEFQAGVNLFYNTAFKGYAYSPALRQFHLQDEVEIGGYPLYDIFLSGKVKRFLFSLKMEHINQGLNGNRYYASPHHPLNGRVFRLGVAWRFLD